MNSIRHAGRQGNDALAIRICLWLLVALTAPAAAAAQQYAWTDVDRVVAISDPHGAYDAMVRTLQNAAVIDDEQNWSGGATHLVITGDLLDRGADSRKVMDLVMQLEAQAAESGGMVHLTLGNHEVMNLVGDLRYVARGEYAAFAAEESAEERERWLHIFIAERQSQANMLQTAPDENQLRQEFDEGRPPGFFAHRKAFSSSGKYGKWLLEKPLMVVVNDTAYVHGGLSPLVAELGLAGLNAALKMQVTDYVRQLGVLYESGLLDPAVNFYKHGAAATSLAADKSLSAEVQAALKTVIDLNAGSIHGSDSPLWYRGTVGCGTLIEGDIVSAALQAVGADRVVIGHTPTVTRQVLQRHGGRVIEIDTGMLNAAYKGAGNALIIEGDTVSVVNEASAQTKPPVQHPRRVGARSDAVSAEDIAQVLTNGDILSSTKDKSGRTVLKLKLDDVTVSAVFRKNTRRGDFVPELAAYRLDRLLQMEMVPVTVARNVDGKDGTLQFLPEKSMNESERAASGSGSSAWCSLPKQWNTMYVYDTLIHNLGRDPLSMTYNRENWSIMLVGHQDGFDKKSGRPQHLKNVRLDIGTPWVEALSNLTDERLSEYLGDVLDERRLSALGKRRDLLLAEAKK
jgi:hypothetical protein